MQIARRARARATARPKVAHKKVSSISTFVEDEADEGSSDADEEQNQSGAEPTLVGQCHIVNTADGNGSMSCIFKHASDFITSLPSEVAHEFVSNLRSSLSGNPAQVPAAKLVVMDISNSASNIDIPVIMTWIETFMRSYHEEAHTLEKDDGFTCVFFCSPQ